MVEFHSTHDLSPNTQAILLLHAKLGQPGPDHPAPLQPREYEQCVHWLQTAGIRPGNLLDPNVWQALAHNDMPIPLPRLQALLDRGAELDAFVESWGRQGGWIAGHTEAAYPRRLLDQQRFTAPPVLYGVGNIDLLSASGPAFAIVGSRRADEEALDFTRHVARTCAHQAITVVSGGARGVDSAAMDAALEAGGCVAGVLADSLDKAAQSTKYGAALADGRLVLLSPYGPDSSFNVGHAMDRNKYVYALADWGLVVSTSLETGGTWAGATEAIEHGRHVFVRTQGTVPEGNSKLLDLGAHAFPQPWPQLAETLSDTLQAALQPRQPNAYDLVFRLLLSHLDQPRDLPELAHLLAVHQSQARAWVNKAIKEGRIEKVEGSEPARYMLSRQERMPFVAEAKEEYETTVDATESNDAVDADNVNIKADE